MKIVFPHIAQTHQIPHSLPLAAALSMREEFSVHLACSTASQVALLNEWLPLYPQARLQIDRLRVSAPVRWMQQLFRNKLPPKVPLLISNRRYFAQFAAAIVPERTLGSANAIATFLQTTA